MTTAIDDTFTAKFQACCLNYNTYIKKLFGKFAVDPLLSVSLQFAGISKNQHDTLSKIQLPKNIQSYIADFENALTDDEYNSPKFAYRIFFVQKTANRKGQVDEVIEFINADDEMAKGLNARYALINETERKKYLPSEVIQSVAAAGFPKFNMHHHTLLWKAQDAKNPSNGVQVSKYWFWYQKWVDFVIAHCESNSEIYR